MIKYIFGITILLKSILGESQSFTKANGSVIGGQTVMTLSGLPIAPNGQLLVYYPADYYIKPASHPMLIFLGGDGEENSLDITQMLNTSLPQLISQGLKPYSVKSTGDTISWLIVSVHDNAGQVYTYPQLQYIIPWVINKSGLNIDTTCIWVTGLSGGGSATWSTVMGNKIGDTLLGSKITGIMPMANGGYDQWLSITGQNLSSLFKSGLACLYIIGTQDPGYNATGYFAYDSLAKKNAIPGHYISRVVVGGTHSVNVWNIPFPIANQVWPNVNMNTWQLMWNLRKNTIISQPPVVIPPIASPPYPVRIMVKYSDSSCNIIWQNK